MVLKLDPAISLVWRNPTSLQFGLEPPLAVLPAVSNAQERMVAALAVGISSTGLEMVARSANAAAGEREALLASLAPALLPHNDADAARLDTTRPRVAAVGSGITVEIVARMLAGAGMTPVVSEEPQERRVDFAVAIGRWVLDPPAYGFWLRRDIPHLPVIYGERGVTVGPTVTPGRTACLYCLERHRQDADGAWPAIASQLWGRPVRTETSLVASDVAVRVTRIVAARLAGGAAATSAAVHLDAATGHVVQREWMPHPDCGCVRVPAAGKKVSGSRRGIDSPAGTAAGSHLRQPRTVPAAAARE